MTNYDFACCDINSANFENNNKKFKELIPGDKIYCICIQGSKKSKPSNILYEYEFKNAMMEGNSVENPKLRKAMFYLTDKPPYMGFKADIHKSGSIIAAYNNKIKGDTYIRIYATTQKECIERAEKIYGKPIRDALEYKTIEY